MLSRWSLEDQKAEVLASHVQGYQLTADGQKKFFCPSAAPHAEAAAPGGFPAKPSYSTVPAAKPIKPEDAAENLTLDDLEVRSIRPQAGRRCITRSGA